MKKSKSFLTKHLKKYRVRYIFSVLFAIISVCFAIVPYIYIGKILDQFLNGNKDFSSYLILLVYTLLAWAISAVSHAISTTLSHKTAFQVINLVRKEISSKLTRLPMGYVINEPSGGIKELFIDKANAIEPPLAHLIPEGTSALLIPILIYVYMFTINWLMALACLLLIPLSMIFMGVMGKSMQERYAVYLDKNKNLNNIAVEYINGLKVIKVFRQTQNQYKKFSDASNEAANSAVDWMKDTAFSFGAFTAILAGVLLPLVPLGSYLISVDKLSISNFLLILILAMSTRSYLIKTGNFSEVMLQSKTKLSDIQAFLDIDELVRPDTMTENINKFNISFDKIAFSYVEGIKVLDDVSFNIKENSKVAIVGPSGSGKSTIARLLAGFYDPTEGSISIDGVNTKHIPFKEFNNMVSYVTQDTHLFRGSVKDNIRVGKPNATDEEIIQIAKEAGCYNFIMNLENGFETEVGGLGGHLSGGERQRISIARAMLKDSPIVILDEATAYMDPENEYVLEKAISNILKNKTVIIIAHRLSTIVDCDSIILMNEGKIQDIDTHNNLLEKSELYSSMWESHMAVRKEEIC